MQFVVLLVTLAVAASTSVFTADIQMQKNLWEGFKSQYGRNYRNTTEESSRFSVFLNNLKVADVRNAKNIAAGGQAIHGVTKFSDLTQEEFATRYLTSNPLAQRKEELKGIPLVPMTFVPKKLDAPLGFVDWTGRLTTPVKDQGYCGSCWAFSATEQIETEAMRTLGVYFELSPEQITQCDGGSYGCQGGWTESAYNYVHNVGGIETNGDYPYTSYGGDTGACHHDGSRFVIGVNSYTRFTDNIENSMGGYVSQAGPLSVCVDASDFNSYNGGVVYSCGQSINHCVQAVGVEVDNVWKIRNSWGGNWGEGGTIRFAFGQNMCGLTSDTTSVNVFRR